MVRLITIDSLKELINQVGLKKFFLGCIEALEHDFSQWESFQKQPRNVMHYPQGVMELMPIANDTHYAVKYVNGHPYNPKHHLSTVAALGIFAEVKHGYPLLISEMTLLTAIRTAATSVLAAKYLTSSEHKSMALIGTGSQGEFQTLAFHFGLGIETFFYYDIDSKAMEKFAENLQGYDFELIPCKNAEAAINNAHILTTATADKKRANIVQHAAIRDGLHINAIGGDCANKTEIEHGVLDHCKVVVEYLPQTLEEGEIQQGSEHLVYAELWELVTGAKPGRESAKEITLFDSVGFALEDFAILRYVWELSNQYGVGENINMLPPKGDPKNLFGVLKA